MKWVINFLKSLFIKIKNFMQESKNTSANLLLIRDTFTTKSTLGKLYLNGGIYWQTLELPYKDNQRSISCIPAGTYKVRKRTAEESTTRKYEHLLIQDVPQRSFCLFHIGNYPNNTMGCILVGNTRATDFIGDSKKAFTKLMAELKHFNQLELTIKNQ